MNPLFKDANGGAIAVCRGCGRVYEGTAGFAISHFKECKHQRLYDALYRLESSFGRRSHACYNLAYDCAERAAVVLAILGEAGDAEPAMAPTPTCAMHPENGTEIVLPATAAWPALETDMFERQFLVAWCSACGAIHRASRLSGGTWNFESPKGATR